MRNKVQLNQIKKFFSSKKVQRVLLVLIIGGALALYVQQNIYKNRASNNLVDLSLVPSTKTLTVGQSQNFTVTMNTNNLSVSGASFVLNFDPTKIKINSFTPGTQFPVVLAPFAINGSEASVTIGVNCSTTCTVFKGTGTVGTFSVTALAATNNTQLTFIPSTTSNLKTHVTAIEVVGTANDNVVGDLTGSTITVTSGTTSSPTPTTTGTTATPTKSPTPSPTKSPTPTPTKIPTPTPTKPPSPTPTPVNTACTCSVNTCSTSCIYTQQTGVNYTSPYTCALLPSYYSTTLTQAEKDAMCQRNMRGMGDADGTGTVSNIDYFYWVRTVFGGQVPNTINTDFNGDGEVGATDRMIIIKSLGQ